MARGEDRKSAESGGSSEGARLLRVLDEVERLCGELDDLSRRQGAELDAGRAVEAADVVARRGGVVMRIEAAARELGVGTGEFERRLGAAPASVAERARRQAAQIAQLVAQVLARDGEDRELLSAERDRLSSEMAGLERGKSAIGAYGAGGPTDPTMQDRRG